MFEPERLPRGPPPRPGTSRTYTRRVTASDIQRRLAELGLPEGDYALHSSAALVLRGILDEAGDLDIVARGAAWRRALAMLDDGAVLDSGRQDLRVSVAEDVEIYDGWMGDDADAVIGRSELVAGVRCASLADIVAMKERLGRPKDVAHLGRIAAYLAGRRHPGG